MWDNQSSKSACLLQLPLHSLGSYSSAGCVFEALDPLLHLSLSYASAEPRSYVPQRWLLYCFTAPAIIYILCQISDYSPRMRLWVILLNVFMLAAGGLATVPWISWPHKSEQG